MAGRRVRLAASVGIVLGLSSCGANKVDACPAVDTSRLVIRAPTEVVAKTTDITGDVCQGGSCRTPHISLARDTRIALTYTWKDASNLDVDLAARDAQGGVVGVAKGTITPVQTYPAGRKCSPSINATIEMTAGSD